MSRYIPTFRVHVPQIDYNTPVIGPWAWRIGKAIRIVMQPCQTTPQIWVEAAFQNLPQLVWSLVAPDCLMQISTRFGGPHRSRRTRRFFVGGVIGRVFDVPTEGVGWSVFNLGVDLEQRIGWYFTIIDATTEFLVNWTTTAYQYAGCLPQTPEPCNGDNVAIPIYGGGSGQIEWNVVSDPSGIMSSSTITFPAHTKGTVALEINVGPDGFPFHTYGEPTITLENIDIGYSVGVDLHPFENNPNSYGAQIGEALQNAPTSQRWQVHYQSAPGTTFQVNSLQINGYPYGGNTGLNPVGCFGHQVQTPWST